MHTLNIYVADDCPGCDEALRRAREASEHFPELVVVVVNIDQDNEAKPDQIFAVPAYLLDGKTISLGNPSRADLLGKLENAFRKKGEER